MHAPPIQPRTPVNGMDTFSRGDWLHLLPLQTLHVCGATSAIPPAQMLFKSSQMCAPFGLQILMYTLISGSYRLEKDTREDTHTRAQNDSMT